jgi:hypothetical protein
VELLRKAIEWKVLLDSGQMVSQAEIAHNEGITRVRVTQIMGLLRLAPEIQKRILSMPMTSHRQAVTERALRPMAQMGDSTCQIREFQKICPEGSSRN